MLHTKKFIVESEYGLHMRPAAELLQVARTFQSRIEFSGNGTSVNSKSLLSLLLLVAVKGTELTVTADGVDAADALLAIGQASCLSELEQSEMAENPSIREGAIEQEPGSVCVAAEARVEI